MKKWRLGGNLVVYGKIGQSGKHFVWYPEGAPCDGAGVPELLVFEASDERYEEPVFRRVCWTVDEAIRQAGKFEAGSAK